VIRFVDWLILLFARLPQSLLSLMGRLAIALVFWNSGQTKLAGYSLCLPKLSCFKANPFSLSDSTFVLFANDYALPHVSPVVAAYAAALAEFCLPILLVLGVATRFSALGLLVMTLVIEIFVYPDAYALHGTWAAVLLMLIKCGPGKIALDHWIARRY
jgi:putative oxidoreductase